MWSGGCDLYQLPSLSNSLSIPSIPCALCNKLSCVLAFPLLNSVPLQSAVHWESWGPWEGQLKLGVLTLRLLPAYLSNKEVSFCFSASLKQPKSNIPLKHNSDADSSVAFYSKGFYFVFFRIREVEINRDYIISSTGNIQIDSLNKSWSLFLFFVVFPWLSSWKWMIKWSLNILKRF